MLNLSHKTVEYHKYALMQRLGLKTTAQLIQYALENGLYTAAAGEAPHGREPQKNAARSGSVEESRRRKPENS